MGRPALCPGCGAGSAAVLSTLDRLISAALPRIENVTQSIAEKIGAEYREADGDAGKDDEPWRRADIFGGRLRQHAAPGWIRLGDTETEEGQRGFGEYRRAELGGCEHDQRRKGVGQDVAARNAKLAHDHRLRGPDDEYPAQATRP